MATFQVEDQFNDTRESLFSTYRDNLHKLDQFIDRIHTINLEQQKKLTETTVKTVTEWKLLDVDIPAPLDQFINTDILGWTIIAFWHEDELMCEWEIQTGFFEEAVTCSGTTHFTDSPNKTTDVVINGTLSVDASKAPGIPGLLTGRISNALESFLIRLLSPNFKKVNQALKRFLKQNESS